jgi:hypothetical protein
MLSSVCEFFELGTEKAAVLVRLCLKLNVYHDTVGHFEITERLCEVSVLRHWTHHSKSCSLLPNACYILHPPYHL